MAFNRRPPSTGKGVPTLILRVEPVTNAILSFNGILNLRNFLARLFIAISKGPSDQSFRLLKKTHMLRRAQSPRSQQMSAT
jgi:hypothetical protein